MLSLHHAAYAVHQQEKLDALWGNEERLIFFLLQLKGGSIKNEGPYYLPGVLPTYVEPLLPTYRAPYLPNGWPYLPT